MVNSDSLSLVCFRPAFTSCTGWTSTVSLIIVTLILHYRDVNFTAKWRFIELYELLHGQKIANKNSFTVQGAMVDSSRRSVVCTVE